MTIYLINEEGQLRIVPVLPIQENEFQKKYNQRVLTSGESVQEVLRKYDEIPVIFNNGF
jgi:hypothetical protein